ncbi:GNAT family N-acetyltransferase [Microbacterium sp.]|uniref:GNAT family N-acetyltransferase n=1 Tax=Microbacterium sp. TaxID=51671 RepID=UPI003340AD7E
MRVRSATIADADAIAALHVLTWQETYGASLPDGFFDLDHRESRRRQWRDALSAADPAWDVRVAEADHELIGFATSGPAAPSSGLPESTVQLYNLYVRTDHHGSGAGQALLEGVLGVRPAVLWVARGNDRAIAFYRRNGFSFDGAEHTDAATPSIVEARMTRDDR